MRGPLKTFINSTKTRQRLYYQYIPTIIQTLLQRSGHALEYASDALRSDRQARQRVKARQTRKRLLRSCGIVYSGLGFRVYSTKPRNGLNSKKPLTARNPGRLQTPEPLEGLTPTETSETRKTKTKPNGINRGYQEVSFETP